MADTRQVVSWSIERKCDYRDGDNWFLPDASYQQLADLQTVANAQSENRIVDGICVTGWSIGSDNSGGYHNIPCSGFRIEERLEKYSGLSNALQTCGKCEANAVSKNLTQVAGCFGSLDIWPDSTDLDEQLWRIIEQRGLEDRLRDAFQVTTPLWYGFWINSPLRRLQAEVLYDLLDAACDCDDPGDEDVVHFLHALKVAIDWELLVHVDLAPLGHTDLGWYTVFPHCPRCKANAPVGRWREEYTSELYECQVCAHAFNPNEHHSSERWDFDFESTSLEKQLGRSSYEKFTKQFLIHGGCTEQQAEEVIDKENNGPLLREIAKTRRKRKAALRQAREKRSEQTDTESASSISFPLTSDEELELVLIPAGEFQMGSADSEGQPSESPQHLVRFERPFYIGRFLITREQWQVVMESQPWQHGGQADLPLDQVSWIECQQFCNKLCRQFGRVFRLPSEAEWEYACRAGSTTTYAFGDSLSTEQANFTPLAEYLASPAESEAESVRQLEMLAEEPRHRDRRPTPVGTYPPNAWGLYDMHGNVDEWCEDVWHANYEGAPTDGSAWLDGEDYQPSRVARGGWCTAAETVCRSATRRARHADAGSRKERGSTEGDDTLSSMFDMFRMPYGFRVVCEV